MLSFRFRVRAPGACQICSQSPHCCTVKESWFVELVFFCFLLWQRAYLYNSPFIEEVERSRLLHRGLTNPFFSVPPFRKHRLNSAFIAPFQHFVVQCRRHLDWALVGSAKKPRSSMVSVPARCCPCAVLLLHLAHPVQLTPEIGLRASCLSKMLV